MRRAPAARKRAFATQSDVQHGRHYAQHVSQPNGPQHDLAHVDDDHMDDVYDPNSGALARGVPSIYNYKHGVIRVWPWPAEGWQVFAEVSGADGTPK